MNGEEIARCPSCSLYIRVIYEVEEEDDDSGFGFGGASVVVVN